MAANDAADRFGLEGNVLLGRIEVQHLVAEGGFGLVYKGFHRERGAPVAIKVLLPPPELSPAQLDEFAIAFAMEARTLQRLTHPNIVGIVEAGEAVMPSGQHTGFLCLEWIDGIVLEDEIVERRGSGGRTPAEVFGLMRGVVDALAMVHREGIAHRDLKPGNFIISATPEGPFVRLLDFGIAKWMRSDERAGSGRTRTFSNLQAYSPQYASPEQLTGARTGPWTDVHAMALILSELLTDEVPLEGSTLPQLLGSAMSPERPTPARRGIDVGAWEPVLRKALSIRPDDRFRDAGDFLAALEATLPQAAKRRLKPIDPDDPAIARTLDPSVPAGSPTASSQPAKGGGADWVRAPRRPGMSDPPGTRPVAGAAISSGPGAREVPRPSTPLVGASLPTTPPRPATGASIVPPGAATVPPPRRADLTAPYQTLPKEINVAKAPSTGVRTALVVLVGMFVGIAATLGVAYALGLLTPRPAPTRPPARTRVALADAGRPRIANDAGPSAMTVDAATAAVDATTVAVDAPGITVRDATARDVPSSAPADEGEGETRPRRHRRHRRHRDDR